MIETGRNIRFCVGMALAIALFWAAPAAGGDGPCIRAHVPSTVVLPDGSVHAPGTLRICLTGRISPVQGLHATWVDGTPVGVFPGRHERAEDPDPAQDALFVFRRRAGSRLVLEAYAITVAGRRQVYRLVSDGVEPAGRRHSPRAGVGEDAALVLVRAGPYDPRGSGR